MEWKGDFYKFWVYRQQNLLWIHYQGQTWKWSPKKIQNKEATKDKILKQEILSGMPGRIDKIFVKKDETVEKNQTLLVMSAMKIEYNFKAEAKAVIKEVCCQEGEIVEFNQKLMKVDYASN